jgi:hypothetical protein
VSRSVGGGDPVARAWAARGTAQRCMAPCVARRLPESRLEPLLQIKAFLPLHLRPRRSHAGLHRAARAQIRRASCSPWAAASLNLQHGGGDALQTLQTPILCGCDACSSERGWRIWCTPLRGYVDFVVRRQCESSSSHPPLKAPNRSQHPAGGDVGPPAQRTT